MIINCTINSNLEDLEDQGKLKMADYQYSTYLDVFANTISSDIHRFIRQASWNTWPANAKKSGTTWIEMLTRFDTQGYRSIGSIQYKDTEAQHRFLLRNSKAKRTRSNTTAALPKASCIRPSLALELQTFKSTFKNIVRQYLPEKAQVIFQASIEQQDKRLRNLGLNMHITAINGILDTSKDYLGNQLIEQAILKQRTATPAKKNESDYGYQYCE